LSRIVMTRLSFSLQISLCLPSKYISFYSKHLSSSSSIQAQISLSSLPGTQA
jgi:hypothetical protein